MQSKKNSAQGYWTYANSFSYNAAGAVTSIQLGNGHWEGAVFNSRLQPTQVSLGTTQGSAGLLKLDYSYGTAQNNGNIQSQTITVPNSGSNPGFTATQNYTYDSLNRIHDAAETISSTQTWKQTFTYDRYGNRSFDEANTTTLAKNCVENLALTVCSGDRKKINPAVNAANNRFSSGQDYAYDSAGNTTNDANGRIFIFDGENKQVEVKENNISIGKYYYDGDGKRVKKDSTAETTVFLYDAGGKLVEEYSTALSQEPQVAYLTNDSLGTPRINTAAGGAVIARHDYHPFGEEITGDGRTQGIGYASDEIRKQFTGYERDGETGLDFAQARYYAKDLGRFTTVDLLGLTLARLVNPQQINRYLYTQNNPLKYVDPDGRDLKLKQGVHKADQERIIQHLVRLYRKEGGRAVIDQFAKSDITYVIGTGKLPTKTNLAAGTIVDSYGLTTNNAKGKPDPANPDKFTAVTTPRKDVTVEITLDLNKRADAESSAFGLGTPEPPSENKVFDHEIGHSQDMDNDLLKEANETTPEAEKTADDFAQKVGKQKDSMSEEEAEEKVRKIIGIPKEEKKKTTKENH